MGVTFEGDAENNGNSTHLIGIIHEIIGLNYLTNLNRFEKGKWLGTTYAKYSRLLKNSYYDTYSHIITSQTKKSPSGVHAS